jgi:hypothetical protein
MGINMVFNPAPTKDSLVRLLIRGWINAPPVIIKARGKIIEETISKVLFKKTGNEIFTLDDNKPNIPANIIGFKKISLKD